MRDYRKDSQLAELGELKHTEVLIEVYVAAFIIYLFYMEFLEPPEARMPRVWQRVWQGIGACAPSRSRPGRGKHGSYCLCSGQNGINPD